MSFREVKNFFVSRIMKAFLFEKTGWILFFIVFIFASAGFFIFFLDAWMAINAPAEILEIKLPFDRARWDAVSREVERRFAETEPRSVKDIFR